MFKRTRIETREGLFGQVVSERKFIFDGHFYPFGFRVEEFVRLPNRVNHIVAGTKAFGRAFVHNPSMGANGSLCAHRRRINGHRRADCPCL